MSRDIFVQDLPPHVGSVGEIPDGWRPAPLPFGASDVIDAVHELWPAAEFTDPAWGSVKFPGVDIEVNLGGADPLTGFALHVRASDIAAADTFVAALLDRLGARALDPEGAPTTGIFGNG